MTEEADWKARALHLQDELAEANETIWRMVKEMDGRWPKCTCHHCWQEPSEASAPGCAFASAWQQARDSEREAWTEQQRIRAKLLGDYPQDDHYVGRREPGNRFDGSKP